LTAASLIYERSWTHHVSNATVLADVNVEGNLEALLGWGTFPQGLFPAVLHEGAHHWTYLSTVGATLAAIELRSRRNAVLTAAGEDESERRLHLMDDLMRTKAAAELLRPLAEGIALFAEFDAYTRHGSRSMSRPLQLAAMFFGAAPEQLSEAGGVDPSALLAQPIGELRSSRMALTRKVSVLGQPLTGSSEGYLAGYLAVRALWLNLAADDTRLWFEPDMFMTFLRSWIFEDSGLVVALLDDSTFEVAAVNAVLDRLRHRLDAVTRVNPAAVRAYDAAIAADDRNAQLAALAIEPELADRAETMLADLVAEYETEAVEDLAGLLRLLERDALIRRDLFYLGSCEAEVTVRASGEVEVSAGDKTIPIGAAREGVEPGTGTGSLDPLVSERSMARFCAISRGGEVAAVRTVALDGTSLEVPPLVDFRLSAAEDTMRELDDTLARVLEDSWARIGREHVERALPKIINSLYVPPALADVPLERVPEVSAAMADHGFFPLLAYHRPAIEGIAALGLAASLASQEDLVEHALRRHGLDLGDTLQAADRAREAYGVPWIRRASGHLIPGV
jgi:hypothetical protein